jgi:hypothetical protein
MFQNKKKFLMNHAWTVVENIKFDDTVVMYHGTSLAFSQGAVISEGLAGRKTWRQRFGEGIYLSPSFKIATDFAKQHRNPDGSIVVLVVRCHLGKIKHVNKDNIDYEGFNNSEGDPCNSKFISSMNFYIVAEDTQLFCEYSIRFQIIDNVTIYPAKQQKLLDIAAQKKQLQDILDKNNRDAKALATPPTPSSPTTPVYTGSGGSSSSGGSGGPASAMAPVPTVQSAAALAKFAEDLAAKVKREKEAFLARKAERVLSRQRELAKLTKPLPASNIDLAEAGNIRKGDVVMLRNLSKKHESLDSEIGVVELIVTEDSYHSGRTLFMVNMRKPELHREISKKNRASEKRNKNTGYSRYGPLMKDTYFITTVQKLDRKGGTIDTP